MTGINTTCPYCGVGCGILAHVSDPHARTLTLGGDLNHPANTGRLCVKGSSLAETVHLQGRLLYPEIGGIRASWSHALDTVAQGFLNTINEYGPDSVALYVSGQLLTEDYYVANKLMKGVIGTANIDTNSRLCMSSAVAAYKRAFGEDVVPQSYADIEEANLIILVGSNTAWCHPIIYQRIKSAKAQRPELKIVVIDPRRTATCEIADLHLAITPGSDLLLFNALLVYLADHQGLDETYLLQHTLGLESTLMAARSDVPMLTSVAVSCGLEISQLEQFLRWFTCTEQVLTLFSQGVNQSSQGVDTAQAIINCHLACGRLGKPGAGAFSLTGQPNAMGGREVGGLANQLAAHLELERSDHRDLLQAFWGLPHVADRPGLKAVDMFRAVEDGHIKAIWIMATNPLVSLPDANRVRNALALCPLVVVSDCMADTDTTRLADILLPALAWAEKDGTVTNSERCISRQRALFPAPGQAQPDWWIIREIAHRLGAAAQFPYLHAVDIFREHAALSGFRNEGNTYRLFNISPLAELDSMAYEQLPPTAWPLNHPGGTEHPFADGRFSHTDQRARLIPVHWTSPSTSRQDYPWTLNTGRIRDQWHTMTRTGLTPRLWEHTSEPYAEIHPLDAAGLGLSQHELVRVRSCWGEVIVRAYLSEDQQRGQVFVPIHWTSVSSRSGRIGAVVHPVTDPISGQPDSKRTAVQLIPLKSQWTATLLSSKPLPLPDLSYAASIMIATGWRYEWVATSDDPTFSSTLAGLQLNHTDTLELSDPSMQLHRQAWLDDDGRLSVLLMRPSPSDVDLASVQSLLGQALDNTQRLSLLSLKTPGSHIPLGRKICSCFGVYEEHLRRAIAEHPITSSIELSRVTRAGTNCGSCLPEVAAYLRTHQDSSRLELVHASEL